MNVSPPTQSCFSARRSWRGCTSSRSSACRSTSGRRRTSSSRPAMSASVSPARGAPRASVTQGPGPGVAGPPTPLWGRCQSPCKHALWVLLFIQTLGLYVFSPKTVWKFKMMMYILYMEVNDDIFFKYSRPKPNHIKTKITPSSSCPPLQWELYHNTSCYPGVNSQLQGVCNCRGSPFSLLLTRCCPCRGWSSARDCLPRPALCSPCFFWRPFPTAQNRGKGSLLYAPRRPRITGGAEVSVPTRAEASNRGQGLYFRHFNTLGPSKSSSIHAVVLNKCRMNESMCAW